MRAALTERQSRPRALRLGTARIALGQADFVIEIIGTTVLLDATFISLAPFL